MRAWFGPSSGGAPNRHVTAYVRRPTSRLEGTNELADRIFYVGALDRDNLNKIKGYVPSKFLVRDGAYVVDPIRHASQQVHFYEDGLGHNRTEGETANPGNFVVVPANYQEQEARNFADTLAAARRLGVLPALGLMAHVFWPGGSEELQRNPRWGIPSNSFVPAYISAASDHFGYVTGAAGLPQEWAENGGGLHNLYSWTMSKVRKQEGSIRISGPRFLSEQNASNIAQGYAAGVAARKRRSAFDNYGYGTPPQTAADDIGDGNGIPAFSLSLADINPDEPTPPTWPPLVNRPVRYLSSTRVRY